MQSLLRMKQRIALSSFCILKGTYLKVFIYLFIFLGASTLICDFQGRDIFNLLGKTRVKKTKLDPFLLWLFLFSIPS